MRPPPKPGRLRVEKVTEEEKLQIDGIEDSFMNFEEDLNYHFGLRRLSLEMFRAVKTSQEALVKKIMLDKKHVHDPFLNWSCDVAENCIDFAIRQGNGPMVALLLKYKKKYDGLKQYKYRFGRVSLPKNNLEQKTGHLNKQTIGVMTRKVKSGRGGKEGNNVCFCLFFFFK